MQDRELLELAAKAAGYEIRVEESWQPHLYPPFFHLESESGRLWNPITDDGDALRLAVKLRMELSVISDRVSAQASSPRSSPWVSEDIDGDPFAATRRAIVRAAAEIGKQANDGVKAPLRRE